MFKNVKFQILILALVFFSACTTNQSKEKTGCIPPEDFSTDDLVGTWKAGGETRNDTLIIKEDGHYKQILHVELDGFDHESDWYSWWIDYSDDSIPYLHLENMRMCVYFSAMDCEQVGSGVTRWYDFCQDEWIQTPGEGVLMVLGVSEIFIQPPGGIELVAFHGYTEGTTVYQLQEP